MCDYEGLEGKLEGSEEHPTGIVSRKDVYIKKAKVQVGRVP
jgi:hypothetical protein